MGANDGTALANLYSPSLIFISAWINSTKISTMIDTGATSSLITMSTIIKLNCQDQIHRQTGEIVLGDSRTKINQYGWIYLNFKINNFNCQIRAIVVDCLITNFILGMDFLRKYKVEIKIAQQCLVIHYKHQHSYVKFEKPNSARLSQQCTSLPIYRCTAVVNNVIPGISKKKKRYLNVIEKRIQQHQRIRISDGLENVKNNHNQLNVTTRSMSKINQHQSTNHDNVKSKLTNDDKKLISKRMAFNVSLERISQEQKRDPEIHCIRQQLLQKKFDHKNYVIENDVLYKVIQLPRAYRKFKVICIPLAMQEEVISCYHDHPTAAHFGVNRMWLKIRAACYWFNMKKSIQDYIKSCEKCTKFNIRRTAPPRPTSQYSINGNSGDKVLPLNHTPATFKFNRPNDYWMNSIKCMNNYRQVACQKTLFHQQQSKQRFDKNRKDPQYEINDLVFYKVPGNREKLEERFSGPYTIVNEQHPSYKIKNNH